MIIAVEHDTSPNKSSLSRGVLKSSWSTARTFPASNYGTFSDRQHRRYKGKRSGKVVTFELSDSGEHVAGTVRDKDNRSPSSHSNDSGISKEAVDEDCDIRADDSCLLTKEDVVRL